MFPFNLDGSSFLTFYAALSAAALALLAWRAHRRASEAQPKRREHSELDAYQIAWLSGGARATLGAALASLMARGAIEERGKQLEPRRDAGDLRTLHPVEKEVLRHIGKGLPAALRGLSSAPLGIERALSECGLYRAQRRWLEAAPEFFPLVGGVLLLGAARLVQGLSKGKPVGFLVLEMFLLVTIGLVIGAVYASGRRTSAGEALLAKLRRRTPRKVPGTERDVDGGVDPALPVALFGTAVLIGTPIGGLHERARRNLGAADASSSGCSGWTGGDSSGGSCGGGGGGGCGGGCGGCGG